MNDSELKKELDKVLNDLANVNGVDGSLIVDGNGDILSHNINQDADIELFGPMAHVITSSSKRLTNFANQGEIERVLVESKYGKALFLHLGNVHFIVLMKTKANVGMVMISSKKTSHKIIDLTHDLTPIQLEEVVEPPAEEVEKPLELKIPVEELEKPATTRTSEEELIKTSAERAIKPPEEEKEAIKPLTEIEEPTIKSGKLAEIKLEERETKEKEISKTPPEEVLSDKTPVKASAEAKSSSSGIESEMVALDVASEIQEAEFKDIIKATDEEELKEELEVPTESIKEEEPEPTIPVIKPPIAFPKLEKVVEVPEDDAERADLILKIYESIFRAMSIGASKIMGVAPARGLTRKFLPVEECRKLLDGVDVKNNSTIDFDKIRENAEKIPISEREKSFKDNFAKIITIITENYGKVMGYAAFRGMVRPEFKIIIESYGPVIDELGIKEQIHPELQDLFK